MSTTGFEFYKAFYYVAKYGTVSRAAIDLYTTQPNITKSIQNLENQFSCQLFLRTAKGMKLTAEGKKLYEKVAPACEAFLQAEKELFEKRNAKGGRIRINTNRLLAKTILMPALAEFRKEYPDVVIELYSLSHSRVKECLAQGTLDFALDFEDRIYEDVSALRREGQLLKFWRGDSYVDSIVAGVKWAGYQGKFLSTEQIAKFPLILRSRFEGEGIDFYWNTFRPDGPQPQDIYSTGIELRISCTLNNLGISFMPYQCCEEYIRDGRIVKLDYDGILPTRNMVVFADASQSMSDVATKLIRYILKGKADEQIVK